MTADFRALCAELADALDHNRQCLLDDRRLTHPLADRARAALAEQAVGPSDEELRDLWSWSAGQDQGPWPTQYYCFARAVLAHWGTAAPRPIPVSERLPEAGDCDAKGRCWMYGNVEGDWRLISISNPGVPRLKYCFSHWLPANALPLPEGGE